MPRTHRASGGTGTYADGGVGAMVKRFNTSDCSSTVYIDGIYEKKTVAAATTMTKYYKALGKTIAMRAVPSTGGPGTLTYIMSDHLGSTATTITNGLIAKESYYPFGATRSTTGAIPTDKLFTGQQQEPGDSLGLYNYGARFYSTALGRFVSVDPVVGNPRNPQSWNAYSYAGNNPLRYTDPTGMRTTQSIEADEQTWHEQRDHDDLVGALLYLDAQNQAAAAWAAQEPHACQLCADWIGARDAYAAAGSSGGGGGGVGGDGGGWGIGGALKSAVDWGGKHVGMPAVATTVLFLDVAATAEITNGAIITDAEALKYGAGGFQVGTAAGCLACAFGLAAVGGVTGYGVGWGESLPQRARGNAARSLATAIRTSVDPNVNRVILPPGTEAEANYNVVRTAQQTANDAGWAWGVWRNALEVGN